MIQEDVQDRQTTTSTSTMKTSPFRVGRDYLYSIGPTRVRAHARAANSPTERSTMSITSREQQEIDRANASGLLPVVFVHGLWLLPNSWDKWRGYFESRGYIAIAPGWPDDPDTVEQAKAQPDVFARKSIKQITDHMVSVVQALKNQPVIIGHSFGGMITQQLAGKGLARASVAIDPAPFRGVLPLPISALISASPVLSNPANYGRAVGLSYEQFRYAFANEVPEAEAQELYREYSVPGSGLPIFQAAVANLNPWSEVKVDTKNPKRGPLLIISGEKDHTVPWAIANFEYKLQRRNPAPTEIREIKGRGHSLTIDSGWQEVAEVAYSFLKQHQQSAAAAE
jgi:pimeloyl-ACP methyl ester carboxylesterase